MSITTEITATLTVADSGSECGGQYQSTYEIQLFANGRPIGRVGDAPAPVSGWAIGAWLAPGAHQDIDGSGLAMWGDSQPGGWSTAHGDGVTTGCPRPYIAHDSECWDPVTVCGGEGCDDIEINPEDVPEWAEAVATHRAALAVYEDSGDDADAWESADSAEATAEEIRAAVCAAIEAAIEAVADEGFPDEPEADDVWRYLHEHDGLWWGDYCGAGPVIAWRDADGDTHFAWHPTADEIRDAVDATMAPAAVARILGDLCGD